MHRKLACISEGVNKCTSCIIESLDKEIDVLSERATWWLGSTMAILLHTVCFTLILFLPIFGGDFQARLLVLTTIVSIEAIYLALFLQRTINKASTNTSEITNQ